MKKKLFVLLAVILILSTVAIAASATPPENAQGYWYYRPTKDPFLGAKFANGNMFLTIADEGFWTGTFNGDVNCSEDLPEIEPPDILAENCGVSTDIGWVVIHSNESWFYRGIVSLDPVTVDGKLGTLEMRVSGSRPDALTDWDGGKWVITGGTGELAGLRGQGTWSGPGWLGIDPNVYGVIPYSGNIHFESD